MRSKILFTVLISVALLLYYTKDSKACFPPPTEGQEYRFGLFVPYSEHLRTFDGMYFSAFYMHDHNNEQGYQADRKINVEEWYTYLGRQINKKAIDEILYSVNPTDFSDALTHPRGTGFATIHKNAFFNYLIDPAHKKVLDYIRHVKANETASGIASADPWDDDLIKGSIQVLFDDTIAAQYKLLDNDNFLKARYLYQDIRWYKGEMAGQYEALMKLPGKTIVKGWAAYFNALSTAATNPAKGDYLFAQAFTLSNEKKAPIFRHFLIDSLTAACRYAHTNRELANLYSLAAMENSGDAIDMINKVYRLDPANTNLHFLLAREVSKLEDRLWTGKYTGLGTQVEHGIYYNYRHKPVAIITDETYLVKWKATLSSMLFDSLPKDRFFFNLCMAHTCLVGNNLNEAKAFLDSASKYPAADKELLCQFRLTSLAIKINSKAVLDAKFESAILPDLKWLDKNSDHLENAMLVLKQLHLFLAHRYEKQDDRARAIMCRLRYNWFYCANTVPLGIYFNIDTSLYLFMQESCVGSDIAGFVNILAKKKKTAFEKYYTDSAPERGYIYNQACNAAGSNYMREANYTEALKYFSLVQNEYWQEEG